MMTRKDYVKVAEILNGFKNEMGLMSFNDLVQEFSNLFFEDNPNFSSTKFEEAAYGK
jgi:rRNA maturation protein Rpf1